MSDFDKALNKIDYNHSMFVCCIVSFISLGSMCSGLIASLLTKPDQTIGHV